MALSRLDRFRHASGGTPTAKLRLKMQKVMQTNCAVFRTAEVLEEGQKLDFVGIELAAPTQLHELLEIADLIEPFLPDTAVKIRNMFIEGVVRPAATTLFPKQDQPIAAQ